LSTHTASLVEVPATVWFWLGVHVVQALHEAAFVVVENVPFVQGVHVLSLVALAGVAQDPAEQLTQGVQVLRFDVAVNVPLSQATHTRSDVGVAATPMRVPAAHVVREAQRRFCVGLGVLVAY
jgi:hypothetical protein